MKQRHPHKTSSAFSPEALAAAEEKARREKLCRKVPEWADKEGISLPSRLALEQCSGGRTAGYKAETVCRLLEKRGNLVDLTGGLGVDFVALAPLFRHAVYVEQRKELCEAARNNFPLLGLPQEKDGHHFVEIVEGDSAEYLRNSGEVDLIFLDPARRDHIGRKVAGIADCEPDVCALWPVLREKAEWIMVKLSPMLDIRAALGELENVAEIHVVATGGECKELLLVMGRNPVDVPRLFIVEEDKRLSFLLTEEAESKARYVERPEGYLYEPGAAVLKAGAFKWVSAHYNIYKLHPHTHLYSSSFLIPDFPGRTFRICGIHGLGKKEMKTLLAETSQANLSIRNFPGTVAVLRKQWKLKEGGEAYWFVTTLMDGTHVLLDCRKVDDAV